MRIVLSFRGQERVFETDRDSVVIGRRRDGTTVDLDLDPDRGVSRPHARVWREDGRYWIEDLGSKRGTRVLGQVLPEGERRSITEPDVITLGETTLRILIADGAPEVPTNPPGETDEPPFAIGEVLDACLPVFPRRDSADTSADRRLDLFYELPLALASEQCLEDLLHAVVARLVAAIPGAARGALLLRDAETSSLRLHAHLPAGVPSVSMKLAHRAITDRQGFVWEYREDDLSGSIVYHGIRTGIYAPLVWQSEVLGAVCVDNAERDRAFTNDDLRLVVAVAHHAAMTVANHQLQERLRQNAVTLERLLTNFSPKIRRNLLDRARAGRLRLGGEQSEVTVLCSDIRGFTRMSAKMEAEDIVEMLNSYFETLVDQIFRHDGTIDKFVGDSILAVFGSPEPDQHQHENAVRAAFAMQRAMKRVSAQRVKRAQPACEIGIGVHCGAVLHGFIGSPERMEYTVIGDAVNRASRLCDAAAAGEVIVSDAVHQRVYHLVEARPRAVPPKHEEEGTVTGWEVRPKRAAEN